MIFLKYKYYDQPDGKDFSGKMMLANQYAAILGLNTGTMDVLLYTKPKGFQSIVGRLGYHVGPLMGMASAYVTATHVATNMRGKDDRVNSLLGGLAAGGVYGAWMRTIPGGVAAGLIFAAIAVAQKTGQIEGWTFTNPNFQHGYQTINMQKSDHTVFTDPGKGWTKG